MSELLIRDATGADAGAVREIYRPHVERSVISFEEEVPPVEEFQARIAKSQKGWAWLVAEEGGRVLGYVYGGAFNERAAYRWSTTVSAYVHADAHRRGLASRLYGALFERLAARGYCTALAGITQPNEASMALHRSLGFEPCGVYRRVGWKFGAWHDVAWFQRPLREGPAGEIR